MSAPKTIEEIRAAFLLIHHKATGDSDRAYMSIPADHNRDADLIVGAAIDELEALRTQKAELAALLKECIFHLLALHLTGASRQAGPLAERVSAALHKAGVLS